jgi:hypothetical protein
VAALGQPVAQGPGHDGEQDVVVGAAVAAADPAHVPGVEVQEGQPAVRGGRDGQR